MVRTIEWKAETIVARVALKISNFGDRGVCQHIEITINDFKADGCSNVGPDHLWQTTGVVKPLSGLDIEPTNEPSSGLVSP
jgi:hypothetical protein